MDVAAASNVPYICGAIASAMVPLSVALIRLIPPRAEKIQTEPTTHTNPQTIPKHDHNGAYVRSTECELKNKTIMTMLESHGRELGEIKNNVQWLREAREKDLGRQNG